MNRHGLRQSQDRPIEFSEALMVDAPAPDLLDLLDSAEAEQTALCTHGETFARLAHAWGATWRGEIRPPDLTGTPKGAAWVIDNCGTGSASARFIGEPSATTHR